PCSSGSTRSGNAHPTWAPLPGISAPMTAWPTSFGRSATTSTFTSWRVKRTSLRRDSRSHPGEASGPVRMGSRATRLHTLSDYFYYSIDLSSLLPQVLLDIRGLEASLSLRSVSHREDPP